MASFDLDEIVHGYISYDAQYDLPSVCVDLYEEPRYCEVVDDLSACFMDFLLGRNFEEILAENPGGITPLLSSNFDVFADDHLMPAGD